MFDKFGNSVVVAEDPMLAIELQGRHLRFHERPLPLVSAYSGQIQGHCPLCFFP
jgi:hypothetical protein